MTFKKTWLILLLALAVAGSAFAQSATTATMRGKITNAQGNAVANAEINAGISSSDRMPWRRATNSVRWL